MKYPGFEYFYCFCTGIVSGLAVLQFTNNVTGSFLLGLAVVLLAIGIRSPKY